MKPLDHATLDEETKNWITENQLRLENAKPSDKSSKITCKVHELGSKY